jgi:protein phosphatase
MDSDVNGHSEEGDQAQAALDAQDQEETAVRQADSATPLPPVEEGADVLVAPDEAEALLEDLAKTAPLLQLSEDPPALATLVTKAMPDLEPKIRAVFRCHIGAVRSRNEDSCFLFQADTGGQVPMAPFGLYIVADGMGGHYNGHEASRKVSRIVARHILERTYLPMVWSSGPDQEQQPLQDVLLSAVQSANQLIFSPNPEKDTGTTLTAALVMGRRLYLAHVGDSRAYLLKDKELTQLTTDHTLVQRLQDAGQLTKEEAEQHQYRNVLYRAVGQGGELDVDISRTPIPRQGKLLLCSDGLWGLVPQGLIREVLLQSIPLEEMLDILVDVALQSGGHDNITGVLVDFSS